MDALPMEVQEALEQMSAVGDSMGIIWAHAMADTGLDADRAMLKGQYCIALERAAKLAAASIRLVEYLNQDRP